MNVCSNISFYWNLWFLSFFHFILAQAILLYFSFFSFILLTTSSVVLLFLSPYLPSLFLIWRIFWFSISYFDFLTHSQHIGSETFRLQLLKYKSKLFSSLPFLMLSVSPLLSFFLFFIHLLIFFHIFWWNWWVRFLIKFRIKNYTKIIYHLLYFLFEVEL